MRKVYRAERSWGFEYVIHVVPESYTVKLIQIRKGCLGGLQYHRIKHECGIVLDGQLLVRTVDGRGILSDTVLTSGDFFVFPPELVHQEEALTDVLILESSTPHFNDRVRLDSHSQDSKTLQTTRLDEVVFLSSDAYEIKLAALGFEPVDDSIVPTPVRIFRANAS